VRVVQLNGDRVGELLPRLLALLEAADDVVQRGGAPEVLLLQAELLTTLEAGHVSICPMRCRMCTYLSLG
jgi:hypothetical protein